MNGLTNIQILNSDLGRFGNQLFRVSAIIGDSLVNGREYYIPLEWEHNNVFPNLSKKYSVEDIKKNITKIYQEPRFAYDELPGDIGICEIRGFDDDIKKILEIDPTICNLAKNRLSSDTVKLCIHIRWGDPYDRKGGGGHKGVEENHPVMSLEYYRNAISYILSKTKIDEFIIFTDNDDTKEFAMGKFDDFNIPINYIDYNDDYIRDFATQTVCEHFIIANSTFSWWSAFLAKNENKIICCPREEDWFGPAYIRHDRSTLLPQTWIRIEQK